MAFSGGGLIRRASDIWADKKGGLWWEWPYKRGHYYNRYTH